LVAAAGVSREAIHDVLNDLRAGSVKRVAGFASLEEKVGILSGSEQHGAIRRKRALTMLAHKPFVDDGAKIFVEQRNDFVDFVRSPEAIEKVQERNPRFEGGSLGNQRKIVRLLDGIRSEHRSVV